MTMFALSHYMQPWLLPPGLNILLVVLGLCIWCYWPTVGKIISIVGFISLWLLSTPIVAYNMIDILQNKYAMLQPDSLDNSQPDDAIVVLGGGDSVEAEYGYKHTVSDFTLHRLKYTAYLHNKTHLPIIVSGGKSNGSMDAEADLMDSLLQDNYNIKADIKEDKSLTTADESKYIASILKQKQFHGIYLVTNAWHMPRSVFIFQCLGIKVTPAPMGYYVYGPGYALISFLPNMDALYASSIAIHEFMGLFWYHLYYGSRCV